MADRPLISVEVAYALPDRQVILTLKRSPPLTAGDAIEASGLLDECPEIDLSTASIGVFGKVCTRDTPLRAGDRVEIYRPLVNDPREARRDRASSRPSRARTVNPRRHP